MRSLCRRVPWLAIAFTAFAAAACATQPRSEPHPGIERLWSRFQEMSDERALALAGDPDRVWVGAASGGYATQREAEESVLAVCWQRRAERRLQEPCRLYATGDEIIW